jgi:hypothetical protein
LGSRCLSCWFFPAFNRATAAKIPISPFFFGFHSVLMADEKADDKKSRWKVPLGLVATGVAGAAVLVLRGCWHRKMSWPVRSQNYSYQVCLGCGIKRLFDEKAFRAYGPYSYDLKRLIAWDEKRSATATPQQRPA